MSATPEEHPEIDHAVDHVVNHTADTGSVVNFVAVDLGASSGRVVRGEWDGSSFALHELHRFDNGPVNVLGGLYWDVLGLWRELKTGLRAYAESADAPLAGVSVNTWGVDYALLGASGELLGNPHHYRDSRTDGVVARAFERVPKEELYARTGIQVMQINTMFQLLSSVDAGLELGRAHTLLMMPDLFHYWLTGLTSAKYTVEYTDATTSGLVDAREGRWAVDVLERLGIPAHIFPDIIPPGTVLGTLRPEVLSEVGLDGPVSVIATGGHDTASAVAAVPDLDERSAFLSSGTWSLLGAEVREPVLSERALRLNVTNEGGVGGTIRLLKNVAGLWLLQESRRAWAREGQAYTWEDLARLAEAARPFRSLVNPDAPDFLNPGDMRAAVRAFCRRTGQPEPESVGETVRCLLESLALRYRWVVEALEELTDRELTTIRVVGGGAQNALLNQFTADACGRVVVAGPVEATALGNLMMQAVATGHLPDVAAGRRAVAASAERTRYEPSSSGAWGEAYARFKRLLD